MAYGRDGSRYMENKRAVEEKHMGPLIKTIMTRCIQCTRCVRFATEIAGVDDLGLVNRGEDAEITTYLEKAVASELTGNLIDVCPVGALTSKPYAFNARPWELRKTETIDAMDAVGSNIRVDARGREVLRILPVIHEDINEEWIADKSRFIWDGLKRQRLDRPYIRKDGKLVPASWDDALALAGDKLKNAAPDRIGAIVGDLVSAEPVQALKDLMVSLGVANMDCRQDGAKIGGGDRRSYLFNTGIAGLEDADAILLVGTNPRVEAPMINARIRKSWLSKLDLKIGVIGEQADLTYDYEYLGAGPNTVSALASGEGAFADVLKIAKRPAIIVGMGPLARQDGAAILAMVAKLARASGAVSDGWNGFNVLHTASGRVGALDLGFLPGEEAGKDFAGILAGCEAREIDVVYNLGADEFDTKKLAGAFVIYQGHHGDAGARTADIIFPGSAYTEQTGVYVNTEGRAQMTARALFAPGEAKEDWSILRALSDRVGKTLPYDDLFALRQSMIAQTPSLGRLDQTGEYDQPFDLGQVGKEGPISGDAFVSAVQDYYLTNPVARASKTMAECSASRSGAAKIAAE